MIVWHLFRLLTRLSLFAILFVADFFGNGLSAFPPQVFAWKELKFLDLGHNNMRGEQLPDRLAGLTRLSKLLLDSSGFSGPIPNQYGQLTALTKLTMHNNSLDSTIPASFAQLTLLNTFSIYANRLTGSDRMLRLLPLTSCRVQGLYPDGKCFFVTPR